MKRETQFVQSHRPYAVNLASFRTIDPNDGNGITADPERWTWARIDAAWFPTRRRHRGVHRTPTRPATPRTRRRDGVPGPA